MRRITPRSSAGWLAALGVAALFALAWPYRDIPAQRLAARHDDLPLARAKTWHYQLDKVDVAALAANPADLLVIDFAKIEGKVQLTPDEVERIKTRPDGTRRYVVAYLSVGESEEYRFYWNPAWTAPAREPLPDWIGEENCAWPKARRVRYWADGWKDINFRAPDSYLKRIIAAGFDGVYLDRVDIYETFEAERPTAKREMIAHVAELAATARRIKPGFFVIPQNAEGLLSDPSYRLVIDGLGKESLLHGASQTGQRNDAAGIAWVFGQLSHLRREGKPVFAVEYLTDARHIARTEREMRQRGLVPTFATRALDGKDPTEPIVLASEVGTPERTAKVCPPGTSW